MGRDHDRETNRRFKAPPGRWRDLDLIRRAEDLADGIAAGMGADHPLALTLRELARRYGDLLRGMGDSP